VRSLRRRQSLILSAMALLASLSIIAGTLYLHVGSTKASGTGLVMLAGSSPNWTRNTHLVQHENSNALLTVGLLLHTKDQAGQRTLLKNLYNPHSPSYHHWLNAGEFAARFAPSSSEIAAATNYLTSSGLHLAPSSDPALLLATGTVGQIETAFHTTINTYAPSNGAQYFGNSANIEIPASLSGIVTGVFGLNGFPADKSYDKVDNGGLSAHASTPPPPYGGGPLGSGLTPSQFTSIYDISPVYTALQDRGQGMTLAVFELSGYTASDISKYELQYHLPRMPIINRPVLGGATDHSGAGEVELDIELQIATAPGARRLLVYESPNTELGVLAQYLKMADDNQADAISTSWGVSCEYGVTSQLTLAENQIFLQMAMQGQSMFAASGDSGAFGCDAANIKLPLPQSLQVGDPGNQPFVTAVGGTSFQGPDNVTTFDPGTNMHPIYPGASKELTWIDTPCDSSQCPGGGSGGGVSRIWASSDYVFNSAGQPFPGVIGPHSQSGAYCGQQPGVLCRETPDVSMDADPSTGYSIYCTDPGDAFCATGEFSAAPGWIRLGGTSCAAPIWAAIAALDDHYHGGRLGLFNPIVYQFDSSVGYANQFHDITRFGNGYYDAGPGYDMSTGVGTPDVYDLVRS
jgi:kumamolisin